MVNDIRIDLDTRETSILVLFDLSAAFNTINPDLRTERLEALVLLSGTVLDYFSSDLMC